MKSYIAYYRVSTQKQGTSGLGLEAQRAAVQAFVKDSPILAEFVEVESGKNNSRPQLYSAMEEAKKKGATLVIAKLDRLSRNAGFIFALRDSGIDFVCSDIPDANTLTIGIFAVLAQYERELISQRTKSALAAKKIQGFVLGKPENFTNEGRAKGRATQAAQRGYNPHIPRATALITHLRSSGYSFVKITKELNEHQFKTVSGKEFHCEQVRRIWNRTQVSG